MEKINLTSAESLNVNLGGSIPKARKHNYKDVKAMVAAMRSGITDQSALFAIAKAAR